MSDIHISIFQNLPILISASFLTRKKVEAFALHRPVGKAGVNVIDRPSDMLTNCTNCPVIIVRLKATQHVLCCRHVPSATKDRHFEQEHRFKKNR